MKLGCLLAMVKSSGLRLRRVTARVPGYSSKDVLIRGREKDSERMETHM